MLKNLKKSLVKNMRKKILVTGGSGFIGSNLVNFLLKKRYKVINIDSLNYASIPEKYKDFTKNKNYFFYKKNIKESKFIEKIFYKNKIDCIFNLASNSHVDRSIDRPFDFIKENILCNLKFIDQINFLIKKKIFHGKFINISTDEVYGSIAGKASSENFPLLPNSPYSASKASVEHILRSYNMTYKMPFINVRCCNNYGPFQFPEKFIPTIIINTLNQKKVPVYGSGANQREWIYVLDFCKALELIFRKGKINNNYNVGSEERISNLYLAKKIMTIFNKKLKIKNNNKLVKFVSDRPGHDKSYKIDSTKIRKQLNWKNKISLEHGLEETINWFINNKYWLKHTNKNYKGERLGIK